MRGLREKVSPILRVTPRLPFRGLRGVVWWWWWWWRREGVGGEEEGKRLSAVWDGGDADDLSDWGDSDDGEGFDPVDEDGIPWAKRWHHPTVQERTLIINDRRLPLF